MLKQGRRVKRFKYYKYEDLASDPEHVLRDIFSFLQTEPPSMHYADQTIQVESYNERIAGMNHRSIENLSHEDIKEINSEIGAQLPEFGYRLIEQKPS